MKILTRTSYGAQLQACQLLGVPFVMVPNTTLNEKFGIEAGVAPPSGQLPHLGYFCVGNGGHQNETGADGFPYTVPLQHLSTDAALFKHLPFIVRPTGQDLDPVTMASYALRTIETYNGQTYVAYWLKRIVLTGIEPSMQDSTTSNGVTSTVPFVPTSSNLNPVPPPTSATGVVTTTGEYITSQATLNIAFTANDVSELINSATVIYGNALYAVISEIGLCSGVDQVVSAQSSGSVPGTMNYTESLATQIIMHITSYYSIGSSNNGFNFEVNVGATEPLYGATNIQTSLYTPTA